MYGGDYTREMTDINEYFYNLIKPVDYEQNSVEADNSFERVCAVLEDNGATDARTLSVFAFFNRAKYCENKYKVK